MPKELAIVPSISTDNRIEYEQEFDRVGLTGLVVDVALRVPFARRVGVPDEWPLSF